MNRMGLGLAVGAGYVLGRTKKMKLAFAVGTLVAGKKLNLSPRALAELVTQQLQNNPQFKEIGDELRQDLRGVGKAASGALVERQIQGLADRLHSRTADVRGKLSGGGDGDGARDEDEADDESRAKESEETEETEEPGDAKRTGKSGDTEDAGDTEDSGKAGEKPRASRSRTPAKKTAAKRTTGKAAEKKDSGRQSGRRTAAKKAPAKKQGSSRTASRRTTGSRSAKGGDHDE